MLPMVESMVEAVARGNSSSSSNDKVSEKDMLESYIIELNKLGLATETVGSNSYDIIYNEMISKYK